MRNKGYIKQIMAAGILCVLSVQSKKYGWTTAAW